ncbi:MAG: hypothetical protein LBC99_10675 [Spirochaetota bacterium]|jgi:hypothetical protein|nr:hypothetical protein [Spirochaetota bacterium]
MKKIVLSAILLALILSACGSSVSKETREGAGKLIEGLTLSLTNYMGALKTAENAQAANDLAAAFKAGIAEFAAADTALSAKEDYYLINSDKNLVAQMDTLAQAVTSFKKSLNGESESYTLAAFAQPAARAALADFGTLDIFPLSWLNACADARELIQSLAKLMDETQNAMRGARDGGGAGAALTAYAEGVSRLSTVGVGLEEKYPYFKKAAADPSLERPVSDLRSAMVALGKEIKDNSTKYEGKDADYDTGLMRMKEILNAIKR